MDCIQTPDVLLELYWKRWLDGDLLLCFVRLQTWAMTQFIEHNREFILTRDWEGVGSIPMESREGFWGALKSYLQVRKSLYVYGSGSDLVIIRCREE
jgi:hypothetical protein